MKTDQWKIKWCWIFILLPLLLCYSPSSSAQDTSTPNLAKNAKTGKLTKVSGMITDPILSFVGLQVFRDYISFDEELFRLPVGKDSSFAMTFLLETPTLITINYLGAQQRVYLEPGDDLQINFSGKNFLETVTYQGKGSTHNNYLTQSDRAFGSWDEAHILLEMAERAPLNFQAMMNVYRQDKWQFYKTFDRQQKEVFSNAFQYYLAADIDYWWAYYLLRYRIEKPIAKGAPIPMELPVSYFKFLNELLITNDLALSNRHYLNFVEEYLQFRNEQIAANSSQPFLTTSLLVEFQSSFIMKGPEEPPILRKVGQGERLKFLGQQSSFTSKVLIKEALHEGYWYKVKTHDGLIGWIVGVGLKREVEEPIRRDTMERNIPYVPKYKNADKLLFGDAKQYVIAEDIYWRASLEESSVLRKEVEDFLVDNNNPIFDQIIKNTYDQIVAARGQADEPLFGPSSYRLLKEPTILSPAKDLPFKTPLSSIPLDSSVVELLNLAIPSDDEIMDLAIEQAIRSELLKSDFSPEKLKLRPSMATRDGFSTEVDSPVTEYIYIDPELVSLPTSTSTFSGKINGVLSRPLSLVLFSDPILIKEEVYPIVVKSDGQFSLNLELSQPMIGELRYGSEVVDIYLEPGNQLDLKFISSQFLSSIQFEGRGHENNNYLKTRKAKFAKLEGDLSNKIENSNPYQFVAYADEVLNAKKDYFTEYQSTHFMSPGFLGFAKAEIDYWYARNLLNYPWEHPLYHNQEGPMKVPVEYFDFLKRVEVSNEEALPNLDYVYFLDQFISYQKERIENQGLDPYLLIEKYLTGRPLNYYRAKLLSIDCRRGKARQMGPAIQSYLANNTNELFNNVLREVYNDAKGIQKGEPAPAFELLDQNGQSMQLADLAGKVIYLDFWATWCPPCVYSLKNSKEWKKAFSEKEVAFVYISLDKNQNSWRQFIKSQGIKGIHLIARTGEVYHSKIAKSYKVKRLPAVLIIDQLGKVFYNSNVDKNARETPAEMMRGLLRDN